MNFVSIDINCDVGEGVGNERQLFPYISSCNIACGGHAGNSESMREVVELAKKYNVRVGAHPSYPDRHHFGRTTIDISEDDLVVSIRKQLTDLQEVLGDKNVSLHHIKPHGALYNDVAKNAKLAKTFLRAVDHAKQSAFIYVPYGSVIASEALAAGFEVKYEAFADRNYNSDLSLVSRSEREALIDIPEKVLKHLISMVRNGKVTTLNGLEVEIRADTYCIHGDSPFALQILMYLEQELPNHHIRIKK